ncbi:helix-turn-helix domain-containing protein [Shinella sp.]|uniref:helix-turn-helix domain-containing protein n=3 Tax=Shinella sp. TaxID=1870904 RepID=UPI004035C00D
MNIQVSAKTFSNAAAMLADAAAVRRRLFSPPTPAPVIPAPADVEVRTHHLKLDKRPKDAHVLAWKVWKVMIGARPCREYVRDRCNQLGVDFQDVLGPSRSQPISFIRHLLMWEIKTKIRREMSYPDIGRVFGGRDHTSVLFACRKIQEMIDGQPNDFMERKRRAVIEHQRRTA